MRVIGTGDPLVKGPPPVASAAAEVQPTVLAADDSPLRSRPALPERMQMLAFDALWHGDGTSALEHIPTATAGQAVDRV
jgi:hypothetical protein